MAERHIDIASRDGIVVITINRPAKRNAMTTAMCNDLRAAWEQFRDGDDRVAILTATGDIFTAGADLNDPPTRFWTAIPDVGIDIGKPVITALNGSAIGLGVVLTAFSDLCIASSNARFIYPEARVGIAAGMIASIVARLPHKIAMELMLLGEPIDAQRAFEVGLVNRVTAPGAELDEAMRIAGVLAGSAPLVLRMLKRLVKDTLNRSPIEAMYLAQREADLVSGSSDAQEGLAAFREKRSPRFAGV